MCCTWLDENTGCKKSPSHNFVQIYLCNKGMYRQSGKKLVKQQYLLHMSSQYGELWPTMAEICLGVWCTPANFNRFRILPLLLQRCRSPEANQTLHDLWPSPGLVHYVYIFGGSCLLMEFYPVQKSLCVQVLRSPKLAALLHGTPTAGISQTTAWYKEWNYGTFAEHATYIWLGSHHLASAHILVEHNSLVIGTYVVSNRMHFCTKNCKSCLLFDF